jgi:hypothetical protein
MTILFAKILFVMMASSSSSPHSKSQMLDMKSNNAPSSSAISRFDIYIDLMIGSGFPRVILGNKKKTIGY